METMNLIEMHDRLMAVRPDDASHPEDCVICSGEYASSVDQGGKVSDITFTQEEVDAAVAAAVASAIGPLQSELAEFKAGQMTAEVEAQIAAVREEMETQIAELTSKLDAAVLEAQAAKDEHASLVALLESEEAAKVEAAEAETRKAERIAKVAEVVSFPEEHVAERAEQWAALSEEDFEALLADYAALDIKPKAAGSGSELPKATAMVASRQDAGAGKGSAALELIMSREDPRAIR